ncbi:unnamed protein product [Alopecurus aequalis]
MENLFGDVVDNKMLQAMPRYEGRTITQEDRAKEAWNLLDAGNKNTMALNYVRSLKNNYGSGVSTMCLVYNSTGDNLSLNASHDWSGHIGSAPYPLEIGNGQWAAFLHIHGCGAKRGSIASVVYRGKNKYGQDKDLLFAWSTPWGVRCNSAYCEIGNVDYFNNSGWDGTKGKLDDSDYSSEATSDGCQIEALSGTGISPLFSAKITAH